VRPRNDGSGELTAQITMEITFFKRTMVKGFIEAQSLAEVKKRKSASVCIAMLLCTGVLIWPECVRLAHHHAAHCCTR
jgi:hypothetical protein